MGIDNIKAAIQKKVTSLEVKKVKDSLSIMIRLKFSDPREKQIAEDFRSITEASGLSDNALAIDLIESGIAQLSKETQS